VFSVRNLYKSYPSPDGRLEVLKGINLEVKAGSFTAIIGESGSGKTTLLQILGTLDTADSGEIYLHDIAIHTLAEHKLAQLRNQHIGFIYQSHHLIPELSALENVMLPLLIQGKSNAEAEEKAMILLEQLGLKERIHHIPAHLSGGEAQRVAVGRALVTKPSLILADEPTGNLDEDTASNVFTMMHDLCKSQGVAVVMVTHSKAFAYACDKVYQLSSHTLNTLT
jgi:lipoprotein-releasing system ATP-binding protein